MCLKESSGTTKRPGCGSAAVSWLIGRCLSMHSCIHWRALADSRAGRVRRLPALVGRHPGLLPEPVQCSVRPQDDSGYRRFQRQIRRLSPQCHQGDCTERQVQSVWCFVNVPPPFTLHVAHSGTQRRPLASNVRQEEPEPSLRGKHRHLRRLRSLWRPEGRQPVRGAGNHSAARFCRHLCGSMGQSSRGRTWYLSELDFWSVVASRPQLLHAMCTDSSVAQRQPGPPKCKADVAYVT